MATSCDPFLGEKRYDDRFYISSYPFSEYGRKWWYCDPQCKPKKGDWVGFWIALKKSLTSDEIQSIFDCISNVAENHSDTIHCRAGIRSDGGNGECLRCPCQRSTVNGTRITR